MLTAHQTTTSAAAINISQNPVTYRTSPWKYHIKQHILYQTMTTPSLTLCNFVYIFSFLHILMCICPCICHIRHSKQHAADLLFNTSASDLLKPKCQSGISLLLLIVLYHGVYHSQIPHQYNSLLGTAYGSVQKVSA